MFSNCCFHHYSSQHHHRVVDCCSLQRLPALALHCTCLGKPIAAASSPRQRHRGLATSHSSAKPCSDPLYRRCLGNHDHRGWCRSASPSFSQRRTAQGTCVLAVRVDPFVQPSSIRIRTANMECVVATELNNGIGRCGVALTDCTYLLMMVGWCRNADLPGPSPFRQHVPSFCDPYVCAIHCFFIITHDSKPTITDLFDQSRKQPLHVFASGSHSPSGCIYGEQLHIKQHRNSQPSLSAHSSHTQHAAIVPLRWTLGHNSVFFGLGRGYTHESHMTSEPENIECVLHKLGIQPTFYSRALLCNTGLVENLSAQNVLTRQVPSECQQNARDVFIHPYSGNIPYFSQPGQLLYKELSNKKMKQLMQTPATSYGQAQERKHLRMHHAGS